MRPDNPRARWGLLAVGIGGLLAVGALIVSPLQNNLTGVGVESDSTSRYTSFNKSLRATADHFPVGSGVGSFPDLYPSYEEPSKVDRWYVNHVHNDYIELVLENGLPGLLLILAFLAWWIRRSAIIWRTPEVDHFARAATIASAAILLHSVVDFPLRTTSISALFAFCIASMVGTRRRSEASSSGVNDQGTRHLSVGHDG
jgi:O-antigen ligase